MVCGWKSPHYPRSDSAWPVCIPVQSRAFPLDPASDRTQIEREMAALKDALLSLLDTHIEAQQ